MMPLATCPGILKAQAPHSDQPTHCNDRCPWHWHPANFDGTIHFFLLPFLEQTNLMHKWDGYPIGPNPLTEIQMGVTPGMGQTKFPRRRYTFAPLT